MLINAECCKINGNRSFGGYSITITLRGHGHIVKTVNANIKLANIVKFANNSISRCSIASWTACKSRLVVLLRKSIP